MNEKMGDKLKEALDNHQEIVDKLEKFANRKSTDKNIDKDSIMEVFDNELENLKLKFEQLSKHYDFAILQKIIVKTVFELIDALIESFIVTNRKE